jgi:hypothetical protein
MPANLRSRTRASRALLTTLAAVLLLLSGLASTSAASLQLSEPSSTPRETWQFNGRVRAAVVVGNVAYVGGAFTAALPPASSSSQTPVTRQNLAAINLTTGDLTGWSPSANNTVWSMAASPDGSTVYAGGAFTSIDGASRTKVAALAAWDGALQPWKVNLNGTVRAIAPTATWMYLGGGFTKAGGLDQPRLARVSPSSAQVDPAWRPKVAQYDQGDIDPTTGKTVTCPPRCSPLVTALEIATSGDLYVGGHFGKLNGVNRNNAGQVSKANGATLAWHPNVFLGAPTNPNQKNFVYDISASPTTSAHPRRVFICGDFYQVGNRVSPNLAAVDSETGALDTRWRSSTDGGTPACELGSDDRLYIGGHFQYVGGIKAKEQGSIRNHLASLPASDRPFNSSMGCYCAFPTEWNPNVNSVLGTHVITSTASWLVTGGDWTKVNGGRVTQAKFAAFDLSTG